MPLAGNSVYDAMDISLERLLLSAMQLRSTTLGHSGEQDVLFKSRVQETSKTVKMIFQLWLDQKADII